MFHNFVKHLFQFKLNIKKLLAVKHFHKVSTIAI